MTRASSLVRLAVSLLVELPATTRPPSGVATSARAVSFSGPPMVLFQTSFPAGSSFMTQASVAHAPNDSVLPAMVMLVSVVSTTAYAASERPDSPKVRIHSSSPVALSLITRASVSGDPQGATVPATM